MYGDMMYYYCEFYAARCNTNIGGHAVVCAKDKSHVIDMVAGHAEKNFAVVGMNANDFTCIEMICPAPVYECEASISVFVIGD